MTLPLPFSFIEDPDRPGHSDPVAVQQNFDALAMAFTPYIKSNIVTSGTITGDNGDAGDGGGAGAGKWKALAGLTLTYTTPGVAVKGLLAVDIKVANVNAAAGWSWIVTALNVSPTPTARLHTNAVAGAATVATDLFGEQWTNNAGPQFIHIWGFEVVTLAPRTTYTFQGMSAASVIATQQWSPVAENCIIGCFTPA